MIIEASTAETLTLIKIYEKDKYKLPLFVLSVDTSEEILSLQDKFEEKIKNILKNPDIVWKVYEHYIPEILIKKLGKEKIVSTLDSENLRPYRDAIITKKLSAMAFYKFALEWDSFLKKVDKNFESAVKSIVSK
jgi:glutamate dehydrogenase